MLLLAMLEVLARSWVPTGCHADTRPVGAPNVVPDGAHRPKRREEKRRKRADPGSNPSFGHFLSGLSRVKLDLRPAGGIMALSSLASRHFLVRPHGASGDGWAFERDLLPTTLVVLSVVIATDAPLLRLLGKGEVSCACWARSSGCVKRLSILPYFVGW